MKFKKVKYDFVQKYSRTFQHVFKSHYNKDNILIKKFNTDILKIDLGTESKKLEKHIIDCLYKKKIIHTKKIQLNKIHEYITSDNTNEESNNDVTRNKLTEVFFEKDEVFFKIYFSMITKIKKKLKFNFLFQKDPFLRFNFPTKNKVDTLLPHVDLAIGHPPGEVNLWLPLTSVTKSNSMSVSNLKKSMLFFKKFDFDFDYYSKIYNKKIWKMALGILKPYIAKQGETIVFDSRVMHKSLLNNSKKTRVSLDFRILPTDLQKIAKMYRGTGYKKQKFQKGHYYDSRII